MTLAELRQNVRTRLGSVEGRSQELSEKKEADWLVSSVLGKSRAQLSTLSEVEIPERLTSKVMRRAEFCCRGWPIQYVVGTVPFHRVELRVVPATLVPRPETEELVETVLAFLEGVPAPRVLDVCTGSGAIALALRKSIPVCCVDALDVSQAALSVAFANAAMLGCHISLSALDVLESGWADTARQQGFCSPYDVVVTNPPYIGEQEMLSLEPMVLRYEPRLALEAGPESLRFYERIAAGAKTLLRPGGRLYAEIASSEAESVKALLDSVGYHATEIRKDAFGRDRIAIGVCPEQRG